LLLTLNTVSTAAKSARRLRILVGAVSALFVDDPEPPQSADRRRRVFAQAAGPQQMDFGSGDRW
jgi:hypothetical protein